MYLFCNYIGILYTTDYKDNIAHTYFADMYTHDDFTKPKVVGYVHNEEHGTAVIKSAIMKSLLHESVCQVCTDKVIQLYLP